MTDSNTSTAGRLATILAAALILLAAIALPAAGPALAQSTIRILVNDEPITSYDIQQRTKMLRVFTGGKQGEKQAIDQLIEEALMMQEAKRRNVDVSDEELEQEISKRAKSAKLTGTQFIQALRQAGIDPETFRSFLRSNLAWTQVVRARFRATINVTEQDVTAALTERKPEEGEQVETAYEYKLQAIVFIVPANAGNAAEAQKRSEANEFRSAFQGCDQSLQQAAGKPGIVVKPQVRREDGQLSPPVREALAKLEIGATTEPERIAEGFQVMAICAKNAIAGQTEATVEARQEITSERGELLARRYLRDLRSDAVIEYR